MPHKGFRHSNVAANSSTQGRVLLAVSYSCWGRGKGASLKVAERGHLTMVVLQKLGKNKQVIWGGDCLAFYLQMIFSRGSDVNVLKKQVTLGN